MCVLSLSSACCFAGRENGRGKKKRGEHEAWYKWEGVMGSGLGEGVQGSMVMLKVEACRSGVCVCGGRKGPLLNALASEGSQYS